MDVDINDNDVAQDNLADMNSEDLQQLIQNLRRQLQDAQAMGNGAPSSAAQNDLQQQLEEVRAELRDAQTQNQQLERKFKLEREDFARRKEIYKEEIRNLKQKNQASVEPDVILLRTRKALQTISDDYDDLLAEHSEKGRELRQAVANLDDSRAAHRRTAFKFKEGRKLYRELVDDKRDEFVGYTVKQLARCHPPTLRRRVAYEGLDLPRFATSWELSNIIYDYFQANPDKYRF